MNPKFNTQTYTHTYIHTYIQCHEIIMKKFEKTVCHPFYDILDFATKQEIVCIFDSRDPLSVNQALAFKPHHRLMLLMSGEYQKPDGIRFFCSFSIFLPKETNYQLSYCLYPKPFRVAKHGSDKNITKFDYVIFSAMLQHSDHFSSFHLGHSYQKSTLLFSLFSHTTS